MSLFCIILISSEILEYFFNKLFDISEFFSSIISFCIDFLSSNNTGNLRLFKICLNSLFFLGLSNCLNESSEVLAFRNRILDFFLYTNQLKV